MKKLFFLAIFILSLALATTAQSEKDADKNQKKAGKITIEELVAKHLASIGPADVIAANKSRVMVGDGRLSSKIISGGGLLDGPAQLASAGNMVLFAMIFRAGTYPYEKAAYDGKDQTVGVPSGRKTLLAEYLRVQPSILKDGLFSGALSTAWPLLDLKSNPKTKLENAGIVKIDERPCYKVKYSSSRTGGLKVMLYFDAETFRHVRSEYQYSIEPGMGASSVDRSRDSVEYYTLKEDFSDFKTAGKLTLPFSYKINVTTERQVTSAAGPGTMDWAVKIKQIYFDEPLGAEVFKVS